MFLLMGVVGVSSVWSSPWVLMELFVCGPSFNSAALRHSVSMTRVSGQLPLTTASPPSTPVGVTSRFV